MTIAADIRLHNREDLIRQLGINSSPADPWSDTEIVLCAYEKWAEDSPRFLVGDFAFAIWDSRRRRLFCCRDHLGFRPFFYWMSGSMFVFANDVRALLALEEVPRRLNRRRLAGAIVFGGQHYYAGDTFHAEIKSVPPGTWMVVDASGARQQSYWDPEIRPELVPQRPEEAFEALRELLFKAVDCRLEDSTAVDLSGGLDSSAVTAIAARLLERKGRELLAVSAILPEDQRERFQGEREFADEFRTWPNIRMEYVSAPGEGPFDHIEDYHRFERTPLHRAVAYLFESLENAAVSHGSQVVLWGTWGEMGASCDGRRYFAQLAAQLRFPTLARELSRLYSVDGRSPLRVLARQFFDVLPRLPKARLLPYVLLTPEFAKDGKALLPFKSHTLDQRLHQKEVLLRYRSGFSDQTGQTVGGHLRVSQPLGDKRVLEFCLSAPPELKVRNGYQRCLIRSALEGVLPARIQWRTSKTAFSPDYYSRYNRQMGKAREFVAAIGPRDPIRSVVDIPRLEKLLVNPVPVRSPIARDMVPTTIYTICFLRQFSEFQP